MAQVSSIADGYINQTGVMSAATGSGTSALIKHNVLLPGGIVTYLNKVAYSSASDRPGVVGSLGIVDAAPGTLTLKAALQPMRFSKSGAVIQVSGSPSIPVGQNF